MIDGDGYCSSCGARGPDPRAHIELVREPAVGVCDVGARKSVNQDAFEAWAEGALAVLVVCDGVSSSSASDVAAQRACAAATAKLAQALRDEPEAIGAAMGKAAELAQTAVVTTPFTKSAELDAPSCTFVAAAVRAQRVTVGWLGDSRAYWFSESSPEDDRQISVDDSWATTMVNSGQLSAKQAEGDSRAHMITRWLGADAESVRPTVTEFDATENGVLMLCSDGLWNYCSSPAELRAQMISAGGVVATLEVARSLTNFALAAGGHDNIAVLLLPVRLDTVAPVRSAASASAATVSTPALDPPTPANPPTDPTPVEMP